MVTLYPSDKEGVTFLIFSPRAFLLYEAHACL